jgi:hypothetical protein
MTPNYARSPHSAHRIIANFGIDSSWKLSFVTRVGSFASREYELPDMSHLPLGRAEREK